jgi:hypothetical protein
MLERVRCAVLILLLGATLPCAAQNPSPPPNVAPPGIAPQTRDPKACAADRQPRGGGSGNETLSQKLEQTDGVICPPDIDPDIKIPTPQAGRMPVIPPPGSPGGDPTVRPK